jgi:hypothetical protein
MSTDEYPYMDTLKCYDLDNCVLTNDKDHFNGNEYYYLEDTGGEYSLENGEDEEDDHEGQTYVEYYGDWVDNDELMWCDWINEERKEDDCFYSNYYGVTIATDYAENRMIWCEWGDEYRKSDNAVWLENYGEYATPEYLESRYCIFVYSDESNLWLKNDDAVWSDHHSTYLDNDDAIEVYTDSDQNETDWRIDGDDTYFKHTDNEYYDNDVEFEEEEEEKPKKKKIKKEIKKED